MYLGLPGDTSLLHDTIADYDQNPNVAIVIGSSSAGISDTIIASHTVGISATTGTVYEDYNLFFANGVNLAGAIASGGHSIGGDPRFVAPLSGDFHLGAGSAAIDAGVNVGVFIDYDGEHRPYGAGFDIGYDERPADPTAVRVERFEGSSAQAQATHWLAVGAAGVLLT